MAVVGRETSLSELAHWGLDLVTVATPPATHVDVIDQLPDVPVICEKPAVGVGELRMPRESRTSPIWVNYAFGFLDVAVRAAAELPRLGSLESVQVDSTFDLPGPHHPIAQMFTEIAVHPWSWVVSLLGSPAGEASAGGGCAVSSEDSAQLVLYTRADQVPVTVGCRRESGRAGITHEVVFHGTHGDLTLVGSFDIGHDWRFDAPRIRWADGRLESCGSLESSPPDPWFRANARGIAAVVAAVQGGKPDGHLFGWSMALTIDRCVHNALGLD